MFQYFKYPATNEYFGVFSDDLNGINKVTAHAGLEPVSRVESDRTRYRRLDLRTDAAYRANEKAQMQQQCPIDCRDYFSYDRDFADYYQFDAIPWRTGTS